MNGNIHTYDQWFYVFVMECRKLGYTKDLIKDEYFWQFEADVEPDEAAKFLIDAI